jgi:hypothetical protein
VLAVSKRDWGIKRRIRRSTPQNDNIQFIDSLTGDTAMFIKTKIVLCVALILGTASMAVANDSGENHQDDYRSVAADTGARMNPWLGKSAKVGGAYGYAAAPNHEQRPAHEQTQSRGRAYGGARDENAAKAEREWQDYLRYY